MKSQRYIAVVTGRKAGSNGNVSTWTVFNLGASGHSIEFTSFIGAIRFALGLAHKRSCDVWVMNRNGRVTHKVPHDGMIWGSSQEARKLYDAGQTLPRRQVVRRSDQSRNLI